MKNYFSITGMRHLNEKKGNEDALRHLQYNADAQTISLAAVADGVSSCAKAQEGAECACDAMVDLLLYAGKDLAACHNKQTLSRMNLASVAVAGHLRRRVEVYAQQKGDIPAEEYSSTAMGVWWPHNGELVTVNLGNGIIYGVTADNKCRLLNMVVSDSGNEGTVTTTTIGAEMETQVTCFPADGMKRLFMMTDGCWQLLFDRGRLDQQASQWMKEGNVDALEAHLRSLCPRDDCTLLMVERPE